MARGYLNRPDEHARRFGDDPFHVGGRIYRTGDRGRFLPDGRMQYLGRYDDQVKIRGFRIEPGEIESTLCEHPDVGCCAVVAREAPNGEQQLVAYIVGEPGCPSDAEARDWLRRRLPEYMVPSAFMHLSALPTTASGKLDKAALPAPSPRGTGRTGAQPPRNDTERRVAALWADLLAMPVTDVNSDFFDMGGHSLLAARLISEVQRAFGVELPLAAFLDNGRTVAELAELLGAESPSRTERSHVRPTAAFHLRRSGVGDEPETLYGAVGCRAAGTRADPRTARRAVRPIRDHRTACQPSPFGDPQPAAGWSACARRLLDRWAPGLRSCPSGCRCRPASLIGWAFSMLRRRRWSNCCGRS